MLKWVTEVTYQDIIEDCCVYNNDESSAREIITLGLGLFQK